MVVVLDGRLFVEGDEDDDVIVADADVCGIDGGVKEGVLVGWGCWIIFGVTGWGLVLVAGVTEAGVVVVTDDDADTSVFWLYQLVI